MGGRPPPFFAGLLSGHLAGVLPNPLAPGSFQNGAGVVGVIWLVGSFAVFGWGMVRLYALGAGVCIGRSMLPNAPEVSVGEEPLMGNRALV